MIRPMFGWGSYIPRPEDLPSEESIAEMMERLEKQAANRKIAEQYFTARNGRLDEKTPGNPAEGAEGAKVL